MSIAITARRHVHARFSGVVKSKCDGVGREHGTRGFRLTKFPKASSEYTCPCDTESALLVRRRFQAGGLDVDHFAAGDHTLGIGAAGNHRQRLAAGFERADGTDALPGH